MGGYIGCGLLILIVLSIIFLFRWRKKQDDGLKEFYKQSQLYSIIDYPEIIRETLGTNNWTSSKGSLIVEHKPFEFYWFETFTRNTVIVNNAAQTTIQPFLAIVFPPHIVSEEFKQKALQSMESKSKFKDFFVLNTTSPVRVERLTDGSFLIMWQVLYRPEIYQQKLDWLAANLS